MIFWRIFPTPKEVKSHNNKQEALFRQISSRRWSSANQFPPICVTQLLISQALLDKCCAEHFLSFLNFHWLRLLSSSWPWPINTTRIPSNNALTFPVEIAAIKTEVKSWDASQCIWLHILQQTIYFSYLSYNVFHLSFPLAITYLREAPSGVRSHFRASSHISDFCLPPTLRWRMLHCSRMQ